MVEHNEEESEFALTSAPTVPGTPEIPGTPDIPDSVTEVPRWSRRRRWLTGVGCVFVIVVVVLGLVIRLPYYVLSPGSSRPTEGLISVSGAETYENNGAVDFLTVSLRQATPIEALAAWVNPDLELTPEEKILGKQTPDENRELNIRMMTDSKDAAQYQALTRLGYTIKTTGSGAVIATVAEGGPSTGLLVPGDVITGVNGRAISFSQQLIDIVSSSRPSSSVTFTVEPFDPTRSDARPAREVTVVLGARESDATKGFLGVSTFTRDLSFNFPVQITINSGRVGGPSAGLAFTLGILDVMTPGSLTGGLTISATGTMGLDGTVGPIGGIHQKVMASRRAGVDLMFVPASEIDEARKYAGNLRVEPVDTLDEALAILTSVGGGNAVLPQMVSENSVD
ncbi:MAG: S16 family serine protease [Actinomycetes bacterium]